MNIGSRRIVGGLAEGILRNQRCADTVYLLSVGVLLAWSISSSMVANTELSQAHLQIFGKVFFIMTILRLLMSNAYTVAASLFLLMIAMASLAWQLSMYDSYAEDTGLSRFFIGLVRYIGGVEPHTPEYEAAVLWILAAASSLFVAISTYGRFNFFMLMAVSTFVMGLSLGHGAHILHLSFYAYAFTTIANLVKHLNLRTPRTSGIAYSPVLGLYAMPIAALCIAIAIAIPKPAPGFAAGFANDLVTTPIDNINHALFMALRPRVFTLAQTGFGMGNDRRLGGNVQTNDEVIMHIRADGPVYLSGNILDTYTGYSWQNSFQDEYWQSAPGIPNIHLYERATAPFTALLLSQGQLRQSVFQLLDHWQDYESTRLLMDFGDYNTVINLDALPRRYMDVHIGAYRTFTAFSTGIVDDVMPLDGEMEFLQNSNGTILSTELMPRDASYRVGFYDLPAQGGFLSFSRRGVLREALHELRSPDGSHGGFGSVIVSRFNNGRDFADILENYLIPHADWVYDTYTTLPQELPQRVRELAHHVTQGASSDYEKAVMVRDYLLQFPYTLMPGSLPQGRDFVDYFLFDITTGYCTYFASAFVVMMRTLGVPARYVEGFNVTGHPGEGGFIPVANNQGHAWGEVYFEGFGWHKFEATPGGGGVQDIAPFQNFDIAQAFEGGTDPREDFLYDGWWQGATEDSPAGTSNDPYESTDAIQPPWNTDGDAAGYGLALTILVGAALAVASRFLWVRRRATKAHSNIDAVISGYGAILKCLRVLGFEPYPSDTPMKIASRLGEAQMGVDIRDAAAVFSKARYSPKTISDAERTIVEDTLSQLDAKLQSSLGKLRYAAYKYTNF